MAVADRTRPVRIWLWAVSLMVAAMVLVGGATRLTESGLSITEWKPVTGALPPLSSSAWEGEFAKYREIPQYKELNRGMTLSEFKTIYFWEWGHRLLGRLIGIGFAVPLLVFWWRGYLSREFAPKLAGLFVLGGLQGAIGWWMVASGLSERVSVAPYRLAVHLSLAFLIYACLLWAAASLKPRRLDVPGSVRLAAWGLLGLAFVQVFLGAIVAGLDAGMTYTTWPLIDGRWIPDASSLTPLEPLWRNLFENPMTAQFFHRMVAYALWGAALLHAFQARDTAGFRPAVVLFIVISVQAALGIVTLINAVPISLALAHQLGALAVIAHAASNVQRLRALPRGVPAQAAALQAG